MSWSQTQTAMTAAVAACRAGGIDVVELPGWERRGVDGTPMLDLVGSMAHDTVSSAATSDDAVAALLRDGHSELRGPLSHVGIARSGTLYVVAAGTCHHAGTGSGLGATSGNRQILGFEAFNDGREAWTTAQHRTFCVATAAAHDAVGLSRTAVVGHHEWAPSRKRDPHSVDMEQLRRAVQLVATGPHDPLAAMERYLYPRHGDASERVREIQRLCLHALGADALPVYGPDGHYGDETAAALARLGSGDYDGTYTTSWVLATLHTRLARRERAPAG